MTFLLARAVEIDVQVVVSLVLIKLFSISNFHFLFLQHQRQKYQEVVVSGDLSVDDLKRADVLQDAFNVILIFLFHCYRNNIAAELRHDMDTGAFLIAWRTSQCSIPGLGQRIRLLLRSYPLPTCPKRKWLWHL